MFWVEVGMRMLCARIFYKQAFVPIDCLTDGVWANSSERTSANIAKEPSRNKCFHAV